MGVVISVYIAGVNMGDSGKSLPGGTSPPALADDEVTSAGELDAIAVVAGLEVDVAAGLVVLVVVLATGEAGLGGELKVGDVGDRGGEGASRGGEGKSQSAEGDHFEGGERECLVAKLGVDVLGEAW